MLHNAKSWLAAAWLTALIAVLGAVWGSVSIVSLVAITIISLAPPAVLLVLARSPEQTMAESIREALTRKVG